MEPKKKEETGPDLKMLEQMIANALANPTDVLSEEEEKNDEELMWVEAYPQEICNRLARDILGNVLRTVKPSLLEKLDG